MPEKMMGILKKMPAALLRIAVMIVLVRLSVSFVLGLVLGRIPRRGIRLVVGGIYVVASPFYFIALSESLRALEGTSFMNEVPESVGLVILFDIAAFLMGIGAASARRRLTRLPFARLPVSFGDLSVLALCASIAIAAGYLGVDDQDPQRELVRIGSSLGEASEEQIEEFNASVRGYLEETYRPAEAGAGR